MVRVHQDKLCESQNSIVGFEDVRWAWQELSRHARYFFQYSEWLEVIAILCSEDVVWNVVVDSRRPTAVSVLRKFRLGSTLIGLNGLGDVRARDVWMYPFTDCLVDRATIDNHRINLNDLLNGSTKWHILRLTHLRVDSPWLEVGGGKAHVREEVGGGVGILDTRQKAEDWSRVLPKNMRDTIRKARRRIESIGELKFTVATRQEIPAAFERFIALEASGWKGTQGTSILQQPEWCGLLGRYLEVSSDTQIGSLFIGDRIAASQLSVVVGSSLVLLKVAYDEQLSHLSPGNVLMANLVKECYENPAIDRIDCTVWQDWHQRWGMEREPTYELLAFNRRTIQGAMAEIAWRIRQLLARRKS